MNDEMTRPIVLLATLVPFAAVMIGFGVPAIKGKIPQSCARYPWQKLDAETWYRTNAYIGRFMVWSGVLTLIVGASLYFVRAIGDTAYLLVTTGAVLITSTILCVISFTYPRSINRGKGSGQ